MKFVYSSSKVMAIIVLILGVFGLANSLFSTVKTIRDEQKESGENR